MANRLLIVSPHFPPVNAPDMQRVRMSLPHFADFGWTPFVLAVMPTASERLEPLLNETVPAGIPVERVHAIPPSIARLAGVGNLALRALPFLYAAGCRLIARHRVDLVYFSTTMFLSMPLGRLWKRKFGTPYVLDIQDPWVSDYYDTHPDSQPPPKYALARRLHAALEPWTMKRADGLIAVSPDYVATLCRRYPRLVDVPGMVVPFGASRRDFELIDEQKQANRYFSPGDGRIHGVSTGRGGDDLATALHILYRAFRIGLNSTPGLFSKVCLHFVGTDYASDHRARKTIEPFAEREGLANHVREDPSRAPYFEALQLLRDADFLVVLGSDDPAYTASKIYPYILARRPVIAVVHERSTLVDVLRATRAGLVVTFPSAAGEAAKAAAAETLAANWSRLLSRGRVDSETDWSQFERYSAQEMTRRQCEVFDAVIGRPSSAVA